MAHKPEVQTERTWLAIALPLLLAGLALTAAISTPRLCDPFFYVGVTLIVLGTFVGVGVFWPRARLVKLPSERHAERFHREIDELRVAGQALYRRRVSSDEELAAFSTAHQLWIDRASAWVGREVSHAAADALTHPTGNAADIFGSFNTAHNNMRLALSWRLTQLRELAGE